MKVLISEEPILVEVAGEESRVVEVGIPGAQGPPGEDGAGVNDHNDLSGLDGDDHPHYALADGSRGNFEAPGAAAAVQGNLNDHEAETVTAHGGIVPADDPRLSDARAPTAHGHPFAEITGTASDAQIPAGIARDTEVAQAVTDHKNAADPHGDRAYTDTEVGDETNARIAADADLQDGIDTEEAARIAADALLIPLAQKGSASGVATLDGAQKIPSSQLPALAITETFVAESEVEMLALAAQTGDVAVRLDLDKSFILQGTDPSILTDWQELRTPTDNVLSVNGETGAVTLDADDVGAQPVDTDLSAISGLDSSTAGVIASDGAGWIKKTFTQLKTSLGLVKADVGLGNVDNTSDVNKPVSNAQQNALDLKADDDDSRLSDERVPTDGSVTDEKVAAAAAIAESKLALASDAAAGTPSRRTLGSGATQAVAGNDSRLSDARTPTAHATSHQPGGSDPMAVDAVAGTGSLRTLGAGAQQAAAGNHAHAVTDSKSATILSPAVANIMVWRVPFSCTVTHVRAYREGGTGATVNARRNGADNFLSSHLSLGSADAWADGGAVQNTALVAGDTVEVMVVSLTGTVTELVIQLDYTRTV